MDGSPTWKFVLTVFLLAFAVLALTTTGVNLGMDLRGGAELYYEIIPPIGEVPTDLRDQTIEVLQERIDGLGLKDINITTGPDRMSLIVEIPGEGKEEVDKLKGIIERQGQLFFKIVVPPNSITPDSKQQIYEWKYTEEELEPIRMEWQLYREKMKEYGKRVAEARKAAEAAGREFDASEIEEPKEPALQIHRAKLIKRTENNQAEEVTVDNIILRNYDPDSPEAITKIDGSNLSDAYQTTDQYMKPAVGFKFTAAWSRIFGDMTERYKEHHLAIVLDDVMRSAPVIRSRIDGSGIIEGSFTKDEINRLIITLKSGSLKGKPELKTSLFVGPGLGRDSINRGMYAIIISLVVVLIFILVYYMKNGIVADIAVVINLLFIVGLMVILKATLTLPGIAGIILTVGMAVDANILILERIREEKATGKSVKQAISSGYARAFWTIFDANLTTLITAYILYKVGTGPIRGFAVTLMLGIASSMYTALFLTKAIYQFLLPRGGMKEIKMMRLLSSPNVQFIKVRHLFMTLSALLVIGGIALFVGSGRDKYGIDFTGGVRVHMNLKEKMHIGDFREAIKSLKDLPNIEDAEIRSVGGDTEGNSRSFLVRVKSSGSPEEADKKAKDVRAQFQTQLEEKFKGRLAPEGIEHLDEIEAGRLWTSELRVAMNVILMPPEGGESASGLERRIAEELKSVGLGDCRFEPDRSFEEQNKGYLKYKITSGRLHRNNHMDRTKWTRLMQNTLQENFNVSEAFGSIDMIGARAARNLSNKAFASIILALLAIIVYITFRFEFKFGIGAILALFHDVSISLGAVVVLGLIPGVNLKINLHIIAAFLTIVGYSLNDTIVVYDRIRENLKYAQKDIARGNWDIDKYKDLVNGSINQTLSRTILTSVTTFVAVLVLFLSGVTDIQGFALTLMVGIIVGTYSSIFIASPVLIFWYNRALEREKVERMVKSGQSPREAKKKKDDKKG